LLFLFEQCGVGLGTLQSVFGLLHFSGGSGALLLETPVASRLRWAASRALRALVSFGINGEKLFLRAAIRKVRLIGLRCLHLSLRAGGLAAEVGVIELQK